MLKLGGEVIYSSTRTPSVLQGEEGDCTKIEKGDLDGKLSAGGGRGGALACAARKRIRACTTGGAEKDVWSAPGKENEPEEPRSLEGPDIGRGDSE